jgi:hypothetical protein
MHISEVEKMRASKERRMDDSLHDSEERERNNLIKKFHNQDEDISKSTIDLNRIEKLKSEGKNPADYGYSESYGYLR